MPNGMGLSRDPSLVSRVRTLSGLRVDLKPESARGCLEHEPSEGRPRAPAPRSRWRNDALVNEAYVQAAGGFLMSRLMPVTGIQCETTSAKAGRGVRPHQSGLVEAVRTRMCPDGLANRWGNGHGSYELVQHPEKGAALPSAIHDPRRRGSAAMRAASTCLRLSGTSETGTTKGPALRASRSHHPDRPRRGVPRCLDGEYRGVADQRTPGGGTSPGHRRRLPSRSRGPPSRAAPETNVVESAAAALPSAPLPSARRT